MTVTVESVATSWKVTFPRVEQPDGVTVQLEIPCVSEAAALALKAAFERLVAEEREACAALAVKMFPEPPGSGVNTMSIAAESIAAAIRART